MTTEEIKALKELCDKATLTLVLDKEHYSIALKNHGLAALAYERMCQYVGPDHQFYVEKVIEDVIVIATEVAREAVPKLIGQIEQGRQLREADEKEIKRLRDGYLVDEHGNEYVQVCILKEKIREQDAKLVQAVEVLKECAEGQDILVAGKMDRFRNARAAALLKEWGVE